MLKVKKQKILLILLIALGLTGCLATKQSSWRKAEESNTITAYSAFLEKYPQSEFSDKAKRQIKNLDWQRAKRLDNINSFQTFINKYPGSEYTDESITRMAELKAKQVIVLKELKVKQANKSLAKLILEMAPPTKIEYQDDRIVSRVWKPESKQNLLLPKLKKLLQDGADPNALRIKGYRPASTNNFSFEENDSYFNGTMAVAGSSGAIVGRYEDGKSLLSFCREWRLLRSAEILEKHGARSLSFNIQKILEY